MTDARPVDDDPRLAALLEWREELIDSGAVSAASFKEAHIRLVLRSGRTEVEQIRAMLPGAVAEHAEEMARVLRDAAKPGGRHHKPAAKAGPPGAQANDPDEASGPVPAAPAADAAPSDADEPTMLVKKAAAVVPQTGFAPYKVGTPAAPHPVAPVSLRRAGDDPQHGGLEVSWPRFGGRGPAPRTVIYRLVSTEGGRGYSPDKADLVTATAATSATDDRPLLGAVRHLQVWVNAGASMIAALAAQPILHAAGAVVGTLRDFEIREDSGRVIGQWNAPPGVTAVHVYRVPVELADRDGPAFRIAAAGPNLTGFVDPDAERGRRYLYRMRCEVEVDGVVQLSAAVHTEVAVSAVREPVTDLQLTMRNQRDGVEFDLEWTTPRFGQVLVFRSLDPPSADAQATELDESVLDQVGLNRDLRLTHPIADRVDPQGVRKSVMAGVPWPGDWNRAYFTPVTVLDGRARLGKPVSAVRTGQITDIALAEYCNKQVLTFDWPDGAAAVLVYIAPKGHDPSRGLTGRSYEIAQGEYEKYGGKQFVGELPNRGCSLHLVPVAFTGGRRVLGAPASIEYRGLLRIWYDVRILRDPTGMPLTAAVRARADADATGSPPFVLVHNPDRIPLSVNDGSAVDMFRVDPSGRPISGRSKEFQWSAITTMGSEVWAGDVRGMQGWIRLFANLPPERLRLLALLDPPVDALRLTPGLAPR
ncbi:hypothetical protein ACAG26_04670 [Mycobacterium sp. pUA109]|uniref:hypothetical protein n=1 Tax=Mycobacterium sp. pUA109 TaxID=3238982 RepID=UPI00351B40F6